MFSLVPYFGTLGTFFADVTGDGSADAIVVTPTELPWSCGPVTLSCLKATMKWIPACGITGWDPAQTIQEAGGKFRPRREQIYWNFFKIPSHCKRARADMDKTRTALKLSRGDDY